MKPIFRWTIGGNPHLCGLRILKKSVKSVLGLYGDEFDYVICHNNLSGWMLDYIKNINIKLLEQSHGDEMEYVPRGVAWKLYPPRLRVDAHEVFMDNDILIHSRSSIVDEFLKSSDMTFITQGYGNYGKYKSNNDKRISEE